MAKSMQKQYNRKRPAHPDEAHSKSKRWFKQKGRKRVRKHLKDELKTQRNGADPVRHSFTARMC